MAKTRTLPDKYYDKDYETNGIHRVPLWRIAGFALNNTATNLYLMFMNYVSFYLLGFVGVGMVMASSFTMAMRIWDGVTDPFIGYMVDKTNGKFGKNRPFMVIGNIILAASSFIMFHFTHKLPEGPARFIFFVVFCCIYYLGYTCQCVVTKSAQSCMTNDPKQRPMFASFDGVFNTILFTVLAIVVANIANKYADVGNYTSTQFFHEFWSKRFMEFLGNIAQCVAQRKLSLCGSEAETSVRCAAIALFHFRILRKSVVKFDCHCFCNKFVFHTDIPSFVRIEFFTVFSVFLI